MEVKLKDKSIFIDNSFSMTIIDDKQSIKAMTGLLKSDPHGNKRVLSYLFPDNFDKEDAESWVKEHGKNADWVFGENYELDDKNNLKSITPITKVYDFELKDFDEKERSFTATASTEAVDRDGDILLISGWRLKNYKKNPVGLWSHDAFSLPIFKTKRIWIEEDKYLKFTPVFAPADINPFADQVFKLYQAGFLNSFSVRFLPYEWEDIPEKDSDMSGRRGRIYKAHELLEISSVNIPSNHEAMKSNDMKELVYKSYIMQNIDRINDNNLKGDIRKGHFNLFIEDKKDAKQIESTITKTIDVTVSYNDSDFKEKEKELEKLKQEKEKIVQQEEIEQKEKQINLEIENLRLEIDHLNKEVKLKKDIAKLQVGITNLLKK